MPKTKRKGSEAKFYPTTQVTVYRALSAAKDKNALAIFANVLTQKTKDRLDAIYPLFHQAILDVAMQKGAYAKLIAEKEEARTDALLYTSHFLQVFNMGIKRGKYQAADRAGFGMHFNFDTLPNLKGDANLQTAALAVVDGEAARIAAGKPAMANPSGAEVEAAFLAFENKSQLAGRANLIYSDTQIKLRELFKEARAVARKIWREVETFYNDGDRERMRKLAREWGVIYARKGGEKKVYGTVKDIATGEPLIAVKVKFLNGKNKAVTDSDGHFTLVTNLMQEQALVAVRTGYEKAEIIIELKEGEESVCEVGMERGV